MTHDYEETATINEINELLQEQEEATEAMPLLSSKAQGQSSLLQSCLNTVNLLSGLGVLALPFAFLKAGWGLGCILMICFALGASQTAKWMKECILTLQVYKQGESRPGSADESQETLLDYNEDMKYMEITFMDAIKITFGSFGGHFTTFFFLMELFCAATALILVFSDSLIALYPVLQQHSIWIKCALVLFLTPLCFLKSLKFLSYLSIVGIATLVNLLVIILYNGFSTNEGAGSLLNGPDVQAWPASFQDAISCIGLVFVGLDGTAFSI
jgi:amino acid permease